MMVGVAVGWELARELELALDDLGAHQLGRRPA